VPAYGPQNDVTLKMPAFEWVHVQLHQQKGMISLSPPTICNSANPPTLPGAGAVWESAHLAGRRCRVGIRPPCRAPVLCGNPPTLPGAGAVWKSAHLHDKNLSNDRLMCADLCQTGFCLSPRFYVSTSKSIIKALINMHSFEIQLSPIG
ncbi:hypothetical protein, partial [Escherichia coli]|uniref:hypothetical protein n=1 Tax=Escherichia coli TaxID=562 RepID=UPI003B286755